MEQTIQRVDAGGHQHAAPGTRGQVPRLTITLHPELDEGAGAGDRATDTPGGNDFGSGLHWGKIAWHMQEHLDVMAEGQSEEMAALIQTMEPMHSDMMRGVTAADFQTAFVCSMIPHHQGAVEMALVAQKFGTDPWVQMFAREIIAAQQVEIGEMQAWLARRNQ
nr:DUF305 domain-containing protein [Devosia salina]